MLYLRVHNVLLYILGFYTILWVHFMSFDFQLISRGRGDIRVVSLHYAYTTLWNGSLLCILISSQFSRNGPSWVPPIFPGLSHQEHHPLSFHPIFQDCPIRSPTHFALALTGAPPTLLSPSQEPQSLPSPNSTGAPPTAHSPLLSLAGPQEFMLLYSLSWSQMLDVFW